MIEAASAGSSKRREHDHAVGPDRPAQVHDVVGLDDDGQVGDGVVDGRLRRAVEHQADGAILRVLEHEHDRAPEEIGEPRRGDQQLSPYRIHAGSVTCMEPGETE